MMRFLLPLPTGERVGVRGRDWPSNFFRANVSMQLFGEHPPLSFPKKGFPLVTFLSPMGRGGKRKERIFS
jgi:hypothetical protein